MQTTCKMPVDNLPGPGWELLLWDAKWPNLGYEGFLMPSVRPNATSAWRSYLYMERIWPGCLPLVVVNGCCRNARSLGLYRPSHRSSRRLLRLMRNRETAFTTVPSEKAKLKTIAEAQKLLGHTSLWEPSCCSQKLFDSGVSLSLLICSSGPGWCMVCVCGPSAFSALVPSHHTTVNFCQWETSFSLPRMAFTVNYHISHAQSFHPANQSSMWHMSERANTPWKITS